MTRWLPPDLRGLRSRIVANGGEELLRGRRVVARIDVTPQGTYAVKLDEEGRWHGLEREWNAAHRLIYRARFVHGMQHGEQAQWDDDGALLVTTTFVRGTGLDLWSDGHGGWEERWMVDGLRHGHERWWTSRSRVFREAFFAEAALHGIEREWNAAGRMRRGFPRYHVHDERVTKARYLRACAADPTLPPWRAADDRPKRRFPRL